MKRRGGSERDVLKLARLQDISRHLEFLQPKGLQLRPLPHPHSIDSPPSPPRPPAALADKSRGLRRGIKGPGCTFTTRGLNWSPEHHNTSLKSR